MSPHHDSPEDFLPQRLPTVPALILLGSVVTCIGFAALAWWIG
jgi:hypothetical protein